MRSIFTAFLLTGLFVSSPALADVAPEPESSQPSDEDTASESEEKTGCSSVGSLNMGVSLFPILCLGWLAFARTRKEE